jgi:hypothetical protein
MFKLLPELPELVAYTGRHTARLSFAKVRGIDTELTAKHAASDA